MSAIGGGPFWVMDLLDALLKATAPLPAATSSEKPVLPVRGTDRVYHYSPASFAWLSVRAGFLRASLDSETPLIWFTGARSQRKKTGGGH